MRVRRTKNKKISSPRRARKEPPGLFIFEGNSQGVGEWAKNLRSLLPFHFLGRSSIILY